MNVNSPPQLLLYISGKGESAKIINIWFVALRLQLHKAPELYLWATEVPLTLLNGRNSFFLVLLMKKNFTPQKKRMKKIHREMLKFADLSACSHEPTMQGWADQE